MNKLSDEQLCQAAQSGSEQAFEQLIKRYSRLVKSSARPYFLAGADEEDLLQEAMFGLLKSVKNFDPARGVPFCAFAQLCVTGRIYAAVREAAAHKHEPLNRAISFDRPLFEDLAESRSQVVAPIGDPESLVIGNEERMEQLTRLQSVLSEFEAQVLKLFLEGASYHEMAQQLQKPEKSVDNAIQRIKRKSVSIKKP